MASTLPRTLAWADFSFCPTEQDGTGAAVAVAVHKTTKACYTVKIVPCGSQASADSGAAKGAAPAPLLLHPFMAHGLGSFVHNGSVYILMKHHISSFTNAVKGRTDIAFDVLTELAFVFECVHKNKLAHCEIHPESVLCHATRHVALTPFGVSFTKPPSSSEATDGPAGIAPSGKIPVKSPLPFMWGGDTCVLWR
jgi:hypothetical protein